MGQQRTVITSEHVIYNFNPTIEPKWRVRPGEPIEIRSPDGVRGQVKSENDRLQVVDPDLVTAMINLVANTSDHDTTSLWRQPDSDPSDRSKSS